MRPPPPYLWWGRAVYVCVVIRRVGGGPSEIVVPLGSPRICGTAISQARSITVTGLISLHHCRGSDLTPSLSRFAFSTFRLLHLAFFLYAMAWTATVWAMRSWRPRFCWSNGIIKYPIIRVNTLSTLAKARPKAWPSVG